MLKTRLIPVLLLKNGVLVRSKSFSLHQSTGNPLLQVKRYTDWKADEIIYLDITRNSQYDLSIGNSVIGSTSSMANIDGTKEDSIIGLIKEVSKICFVPMTIGGKIKSLEDIRLRLEAGADKVSINSAAINNPGFIDESAKEFGSQCIVISIDVKKNIEKGVENWMVFKSFGKKPTSYDLESWSKEVENRGAGEILIQSIDNDGKGIGYDIGMINKVVDVVNIPVIALGGVGEFKHLSEGYYDGRASALSAANIFHFTEQSILNAKEFLIKKNIDVRL